MREIARHLLPTRRGRTNPRVVKRKMSSFKVKRDEHRKPVPRQPEPLDAVTIAPHWRTTSTTATAKNATRRPKP